MARRKTEAKKDSDAHAKALMEGFAEKVTEVRRTKGLTQTAAAALIGISNKQLNNIERAVVWPSMPVYLSIIRVFKLPKPTLF